MAQRTLRICAWCKSLFDDGGLHQRKYCSDVCIVEGRRRTARLHAAKRYRKRISDPRPCIVCGKVFTPKRHDATMCSGLCKDRRQSANRSRKIQAQRRCVGCGTKDQLPTIGKPVCPDCKKDNRDPEMLRKRELRRKYLKYGITEDDYFRMFEQQSQRCAICLTEKTTGRGWQIDHCHKTGVVRGILCHLCNTALGSFKDDPVVLRAAIEYLSRSSTPEST